MSDKKGNTINFKGEVNIGKDFVAGDKTININQTAIVTPVEFIYELKTVQTKINELKQDNELTKEQKAELVIVEQKVTEALEITKQPKPDGEKIQNTLEEAKKKMETLAGSLTAAIGLGTVLAKLVETAIKVFGG